MSKSIFLFIAVAILAVIGGVTWYYATRPEPARTRPRIPDIAPSVAWPRFKQEDNVVILDVRTPEEYAERHIPGSVLVNLSPPGTFLERAKKELPDKNATIYAFCRSGRRSLSAAEILAADGYKNVYNLGGIEGWPYETTSTQP